MVSQLLNSNGYLISYSEFLGKYCIPVTPHDFAIVMDTIPSGAIALLKNSDSVHSVISLTNPCETVIGKICFGLSSSFRNRKIRHLFQNDITTVPSVVFDYGVIVFMI